jgi:hypothetical protein
MNRYSEAANTLHIQPRTQSMSPYTLQAHTQHIIIRGQGSACHTSPTLISQRRNSRILGRADYTRFRLLYRGPLTCYISERYATAEIMLVHHHACTVICIWLGQLCGTPGRTYPHPPPTIYITTINLWPCPLWLDPRFRSLLPFPSPLPFCDTSRGGLQGAKLRPIDGPCG